MCSGAREQWPGPLPVPWVAVISSMGLLIYKGLLMEQGLTLAVAASRS